jgi:hypothetical protein
MAIKEISITNASIPYLEMFLGIQAFNLSIEDNHVHF